MTVRLINIGFNNIIVSERIISIVNSASSPVKRLIEVARKRGSLIDATCGRRTRSVIITDSNHVILSALQPETIGERFLQKTEKAEKRVLPTSGITNQYKLRKRK